MTIILRARMRATVGPVKHARQLTVLAVLVLFIAAEIRNRVARLFAQMIAAAQLPIASPPARRLPHLMTLHRHRFVSADACYRDFGCARRMVQLFHLNFLLRDVTRQCRHEVLVLGDNFHVVVAARKAFVVAGQSLGTNLRAADAVTGMALVQQRFVMALRRQLADFLALRRSVFLPSAAQDRNRR